MIPPYGSYELPVSAAEHDATCGSWAFNISDGEQGECADCRSWVTLVEEEYVPCEEH